MKSICFVLLCLLWINLAFSQNASQPAFKVVPLGVKGGVDESNLSAYLVAANGTDDYICLDAGTIHAGIQKAIESGVFHKSAEAVLRQNIKAYFISHAHLDHVAGMIINSPEDSSKNIYGLPFCLNILKEKYFTWKNWANFTNEGDTPRLNKYHFVALDTSKETPIPHTGFSVRAFPLSHSNPYQSTAFLVREGDNYILYLGDTGPDEVEKSFNLLSLWIHIGPLITSKKLKAIMIEVSFPNEQADKQLFGHLTPKWLMKEMRMLRQFTAPESLIGFPIVITHIKPHGNNEALIKEQLKKENELKMKLVYPEQGKILVF